MIWYVYIEFNTSSLPGASWSTTTFTQLEKPEIPALVWHLIKIYKAYKSNLSLNVYRNLVS